MLTFQPLSGGLFFFHVKMGNYSFCNRLGAAMVQGDHRMTTSRRTKCGTSTKSKWDNVGQA